MPTLITISDGGPAPAPASTRKALDPKTAPLRSLRTEVKIPEVKPNEVKQAMKLVRKATMAAAVRGARLSLVALANGRFEEAGNVAVNAAIGAAAAWKENPEMATRIMTTARGVVRNAIKGIMSKTV